MHSPDPNKVVVDDSVATALPNCRWGRRTDALCYECVTCGAQMTDEEVRENLKEFPAPIADQLRRKCPSPGRVPDGGCGKDPENHFAHLAEHVRTLQGVGVQLPELRWWQKLRYWLCGQRAPTPRERWAEQQRRAREHINDHRRSGGL